jgi:lysophospholipase L1-like esterase
MRSLNVKVGTLSAALALAGCFEGSNDSGNGDNGITPQEYVAVGNSLTAGFMDGGLVKTGQEASYPVLLAKAMGVEDFQIPTIDTPGVGSLKIAGNNTTPLAADDSGNIAPKLLTKPVDKLLLNGALLRPYNDLGVPGASTRDFMHAFDSGSSQAGNNGYFNIVLRGGVLNNTSMMRQAILLKPTLMTLWVGSNDILGGITAGTVVEGKTVTPVAFYKSMMDSAFDTLTTELPKTHIFVANIPSITSIPFVTTIPPVVVDPKTNQPVKGPDGNYIPLVTKEKDVKYVLLPALSLLKKGIGIPKALGGTDSALAAELTLSAEEVATAEALTTGYNDYLKGKAEADTAHLTLVDVNALMAKLTKGEISGLTATFPLLDPTHSAFSLDGIHPNAKGYKEVARLYLDAINARLGKSYKID